MKKRSYIPLLIIAVVVIVAAAALLIFTRTQSLNLSGFDADRAEMSVFVGSTGETVKISSADEKQAVLDLLSRAHARNVLTHKKAFPNEQYLYLTVSSLDGAFRGFHFDLGEGSVYTADKAQSRITDPAELLSFFSQFVSAG